MLSLIKLKSWSVSAVAALRAVRRQIGDVFGRLSNWNGEDPCGSPRWTGVYCVNVTGTQHVKELRLLHMNFTGILAPDFGNFTHLTILDVMWNNITGSIPPEIGNLRQLYFLLLNGNKLTGILPPELGNLANLNRLQIDENNISGPVPASFQNLNKAKHFHMNNNSLNGSIPKELGNLESLVHLLLDNNDLTGELPVELANIPTLLILQLDNNPFTGSIPSNYSHMVNLTKMSLRNCNLTGPIPDLTPLASLGYLDLSHNHLSGMLPSGPLSTSLTTIDFSYNQLDGPVPVDFLEVPKLDFLILRDNSLDGNITVNDIQHAAFRNSQSIFVLDFQNNNLTAFVPGALNSIENVRFRLFGNPVCSNTSLLPPKICIAFNGSNSELLDDEITPELSTSCQESTCDATHNQHLDYGLLTQRGVCQCAYPLEVGYRLKSPGFAIFEPYEDMFRDYLSSGLNFSSYQVNVSQYNWEPGPRIWMLIMLFPRRDIFNNSDVQHLYDTFTTWNIPYNNTFGPYEATSFDIGFPYNESFAASGKSLSGGAIAGIVIATVVFTATVVGAAMFFVIRHRGPSREKKHYRRIKVAGVKDFTYEEISKATNNFDDSMQIGKGGYGKVYKAILVDGVVAAVKRAQEGSLQGAKEFYTELELLSHVHHRNVVSLLGFCDDQGEQMLVYEFMENGTLQEHLNSKLKVALDFPTRIQIALGSARGILYLHTEVSPPIYHRDIKASNILLDEKRRAKVADFGLSKLAPNLELEDASGGPISTVVKGTPGYLDPEYLLTHKLTDKSDVYSFGVVLLELVTGTQPISHGINLVRKVNLAYEAGMMVSIVDPRMGSYPSESLEPLVILAISCCKDDTDSRPTMAEVVRRLEAIWCQTPIPESMTSFEIYSRDTDSTPPKANASSSNNPYIPSDIDGSVLMSGTISNLSPR